MLFDQTRAGGNEWNPISITFKVVYGVSGDGLTVKQFLLTRLAAILPMARTKAQFHDHIVATTPKGVWVATTLTMASS